MSQSETPSQTPLLSVRGLTKSFGETRALRRADFALGSGEIHALVGENGAGKSTLIRILAGDHRPDAGEILLDGRPVAFAHPFDAISKGVGFVHQVPAFVPDMSVTENFLLGLPYDRRKAGLIDWRSAHRDCAGALEALGLVVDPRVSVRTLGAHERQLVAVARALRRNPRILILDEVTASLSEPEVDVLLGQIEKLKRQGTSIVYVSHRLEEIFRVADRATVLRDGRNVATLEVKGLTVREIARHIVGSDVGDVFAHKDIARPAGGATPRLSVRGLGDERICDISFDVAPGEIVGVAGLGSSGRSRLLRMLFGAIPTRTGEIRLDGDPQAFGATGDALAAGIALITEDRNTDGYVASLPIWQNVTLPWAARFRLHGMLRLSNERSAATNSVRRLEVKTPSIDASMTQLSGGNQQKAIFARWITGPVRLLLLDEPTHGVDIGSKSQIYDIIRDLAAGGISVLVVSSELEELQALCDRVLLLRGGTIGAELSGAAISKDAILHHLLASEQGAPQ